jgi:hypothetical protein
LSALDEDFGVDQILGKEVDELEELVINNLVINVLLDFVKERDFIRGNEGLRKRNGRWR